MSNMEILDIHYKCLILALVLKLNIVLSHNLAGV